MKPRSGEPEKAVATYVKRRPTHEGFSAYICGLIESYIDKSLIHTTENRAKTLDSFERKAHKIRENGDLYYKDPLSEITDLSGVRIIVFTRDNVDKVCTEIGEILDIIEIEDVGERVYKLGKFGYQSKHLLVRLGEDRKSLFENSEFVDLVCEIQVRTILQHAWAEMEHDIQYKSDNDIPVDLSKRFSALAGLLELADQEFQRIQTDSANLKQAVKVELINDLTQEGLTDHSSSKLSGTGPTTDAIKARDLVIQGRYKEAIDLYSAKLAIEPADKTLYIGRSRAKFLAGDVRGAVADLDVLDSISGNSSSTATLRSIIEKGDSKNIIFQALHGGQRHSEGLAHATEALRAGEGVKAFEEYNKLEASGYNKAFSLIGKAMCCVLERDTDGANSFMETLSIRSATPMAVNILCLKTIIAIMDKNDTEQLLLNLGEAVAGFPDYHFEVSPLRDLRSGLSMKGYEDQSEIEKVFAILPS